jgi:hypothetical protein
MTFRFYRFRIWAKRHKRGPRVFEHLWITCGKSVDNLGIKGLFIHRQICPVDNLRLIHRSIHRPVDFLSYTQRVFYELSTFSTPPTTTTK